MIVAFEKTERVRHIGHLDMQRAMQRALRRSGLPEDYESYENLHHIDPKTGEHIEMPPQPTPEERRAKKAAARAASRAAGAARAERLRSLVMKNARGKRPPDDKDRK